MNQETKDRLWADYSAGKGVATTPEERADIFREWRADNPWWDEKYNTSENVDILMNEMASRGYEVSLVTIQSAINALFAKGGLLKKKTEPAIVGAESSVEATPDLKAFAEAYKVLPAGDVKNKMRNPEYRETLDQAIAAGLV